MKKYKIVYQKNNDTYVENIEASNKREAIATFYMKERNTDIIKIEEVN